jgi:hypothetical protein
MKELRHFVLEFEGEIFWLRRFRPIVTEPWQGRIHEAYRNARICLRRIELFHAKGSGDEERCEEIAQQCDQTQRAFEKLKSLYVQLFAD